MPGLWCEWSHLAHHALFTGYRVLHLVSIDGVSVNGEHSFPSDSHKSLLCVSGFLKSRFFLHVCTYRFHGCFIWYMSVEATHRCHLSSSISSLPYFVLHYLMHVSICIKVRRLTCRSQFSPSTIWSPGLNSGLHACQQVPLSPEPPSTLLFKIKSNTIPIIPEIKRQRQRIPGAHQPASTA